MKHKMMFGLCGVLLLIQIVSVYYLGEKAPTLDMVKVNEVIQQLITSWDQQEDVCTIDADFSYVVMKPSGKRQCGYGTNLPKDLHEAIKQRTTMVDILDTQHVYGKLVIMNDQFTMQKQRLQHIVMMMSILELLIFILYYVYLQKTMIKPFQKLQTFAKHIAQGDLNHPLPMDQSHIFGAFSESFDMMRDELCKAREQERIANESKKELVAKLSHDIKTPIASIEAVSELMSVKSKDEKEKQQLAVIQAKATQIDALINNLFSATLEELSHLDVHIEEMESTKLIDMIKQADYLHKACIDETKPCLIYMDVLRLQQVFDNLFANAYKYAKTDMSVSFAYEDDFLCIMIQDYGHTLSKDDLPFLFKKYYRGNNASHEKGAGLGLYISHYLMEKMKGRLEVELNEQGCCMKLYVKLVN